MIEIDDKHKQVLQWAIQAYYEDYLETKKDKLEELKALEESISEMKAIMALLGSPPEKPLSEDTVSSDETTQSTQLSQPVSMQQSSGEDTSKEQDVEQQPSSEIPEKSEKEKKLSAMSSAGTMRPSDLKLMAFDYNKNNMQQYKMILFQELDGRVVIEYNNSHYYTSKIAVMQIPYPIPSGYFSKKNGWSSTVEQAFKNYRKYLAEQEQEQDKPVIEPLDQAGQESSIEDVHETQAQEAETAAPATAEPQPVVDINETRRVHHGKKIPISDSLDMVSEMSDQGMQISEMALKLNVTEETVNRYLKMIEAKKRRHEKASNGQVEESEPEQTALHKLKELAETHPSITKDDIIVEWFECDPSQGEKIKGHENCKVVEMPDGRAMVQYKDGTHYYTSKEKVMKIPYPIPKGYFRGAGLSSVAEVCIRAYRHYLAISQQEHEESGQETESKTENVNEKEERDNETDKPRLEFFKEDSGFDYANVNPQYIGGSTVYRSKAGKLVIKYQGKNTQGELLLTKDQDIEKLMNYNEKEVDWVIRSLSAEKRNILRGYLRDLKALNMVVAQ